VLIAAGWENLNVSFYFYFISFYLAVELAIYFLLAHTELCCSW